MATVCLVDIVGDRVKVAVWEIPIVVVYFQAHPSSQILNTIVFEYELASSSNHDMGEEIRKVRLALFDTLEKRLEIWLWNWDPSLVAFMEKSDLIVDIFRAV